MILCTYNKKQIKGDMFNSGEIMQLYAVTVGLLG